MYSSNTYRYKALIAGFILSITVQATYADWQQARFDEAAENASHISVTGTAEGWLETYGHPKLRISCDTTSDGGDLYLGFHFPAAHGFLGQQSRNEPVKFRVSGPEPDGIVQETIEYLSVPVSEQSVFRTLLASEGVASTRQSGKLLLDLHYGHQLDVQFVYTPKRYSVRYSLSGFSEIAGEVMRSCQMSGFSYADLGKTWADYITIGEVAGLLTVQRPQYGAAQPAP